MEEWSNGVLEYWSIGVLEQWADKAKGFTVGVTGGEEEQKQGLSETAGLD
jgi:hypothetical protein